MASFTLHFQVFFNRNLIVGAVLQQMSFPVAAVDHGVNKCLTALFCGSSEEGCCDRYGCVAQNFFKA